MNTEHLELVRRLSKNGAAIVSEMTAAKAHLWHMATGMANEAAEIVLWESRDNLIEELGDFKFYHVGACDCVGYDPDAEMDIGLGFEHPKQSLIVMSGQFLDVVKKHVVYNQPLNERSACLILYGMLHAYYGICKMHGIDTSIVEGSNIDKLNTRYPNKSYSDSDAKERKDKNA